MGTPKSPQISYVTIEQKSPEPSNFPEQEKFDLVSFQRSHNTEYAARERLCVSHFLPDLINSKRRLISSKSKFFFSSLPSETSG